jgi:hypothetical protein
LDQEFLDHETQGVDHLDVHSLRQENAVMVPKADPPRIDEKNVQVSDLLS